MTVPQSTMPSDPPIKRDWLSFTRGYLGSRWALMTLGVLVLVVAAFFNWGWLVAVGVAPILVALAPCAIMCALGLCGMKMMGGVK